MNRIDSNGIYGCRRRCCGAHIYYFYSLRNAAAIFFLFRAKGEETKTSQARIECKRAVVNEDACSLIQRRKKGYVCYESFNSFICTGYVLIFWYNFSLVSLHYNTAGLLKLCCSVVNFLNIDRMYCYRSVYT